ncbi:glycoside hydrolase family 3 C-terminal domain-containing protein [Herbiconiux sp. KACC 21604]|uniref:glycoside hydrolase family 3 C-terminal domain-containing protein n=1 Tax=unclassified Herbiconiux TaxID=2618217 RepID=UPI001492E3EE|nr:glycoside hydrolase family 3 C-terminal domain-containing protein [Herbiconiux sp. SALV-R1]QJU53342.1 glycosyl hydrolase [Herbiconiux sp. SALV-R1]WPO88304.1 glycoside hydrolase family 3 C-terminal domain-containing protein [Herbiconiux sp. KACC 21604]
MTAHDPEQLPRLTDAEKVGLTAGDGAWKTDAVPRAGVRSVRLGDGPHGVRRPHEGAGLSLFDSHPATCFPTAAALGASWNPGLLREVGEALGREATSQGIGVLLGPGVNLKRTPVGGRNFEYFSEDPLVSARLGAAWVAGVQSTGVGASLKHFAANNTESRRYGVDAVVDERALRELYLPAFEHIVTTERPATVMAAYNKLNGEHCTENRWLLHDVLRTEWGFEGVVVSDWGASWDRTISIPAGCDLTMPGLGRSDDRYVLGALAAGTLPRDALDRAAERILALAARHGRAGRRFGLRARQPVDLAAHHELARRASAAGTVLLKNDGGLLPLAGTGRVAVIGRMAAEPRFQGAGSSHVVPTRVETLLTALRQERGLEVEYAVGYDGDHDSATDAQIAEAQRVAVAADTAIVVVGLPETYETEGVDRSHLRLPGAHDRLVRAVLAVNPRTVVVLQNGSPVQLPWRHDAPAVVEGYLGGQAGGIALADVLLGRAEPAGRLAETFPEHYDDHPVSRLHDGPATLEYRESLYVGYRYFDSAHEDVAFCFGHGLSYTTFDWSDVEVVEGDGGDPAHPEIEVRVTVTNTGKRRGVEVVQLYVHDEESSLFRPEHELRGFARAELEPGESARLGITLDRRSFAFWNPAGGGWMLEAGGFELRLGRSSRDILWRGRVDLAGDGGGDGDGDAAVVDAASGAPRPDPYRSPSRATGFPAAAFEALLGRSLPPNLPDLPGGFTLDTAIRDMQGVTAARILFRVMHRQALKTLGAPPGRAVDEAAGDVVAQLNFRMLPTVSDTLIGRRGARRLLRVVNRLAKLGGSARKGRAARRAGR